MGWGFQPYRVHLLWHAHFSEPFPALVSCAPGRFSLHVGHHRNECASSLGVLVRVLNPASWKNAPKLISLPCGSAGKDSACNAGDLGSIPGLGRSPGEGKGYPLQYSGLEDSMDYSPWGHKELDMTERLTFTLLSPFIQLYDLGLLTKYSLSKSSPTLTLYCSSFGV